MPARHHQPKPGAKPANTGCKSKLKEDDPIFGGQKKWFPMQSAIAEMSCVDPERVEQMIASGEISSVRGKVHRREIASVIAECASAYFAVMK